MIIVTGANGKLGRATVKSLLSLRPAAEIAASVRDPERAGDLRDLGVQVRRADYRDPDSLRWGFEGAEQVLMVSSNAGAEGDDPMDQHRNVVAAARDAGVGRIVYTSHMGASPTSAFPPMHTHHATEQMLRESGLAWTSLRNGFYASSIVDLLRDPIRAGVIVLPEDGQVSWTAHADLARAAAEILARPGAFEGPTPPLTAGEALDIGEIAGIATALVGHRVRREVISDEEMAQQLQARGLPAAAVAITIGMFVASRNGEFARVDPTLAGLVGGPTTPLRSLLAEQLQE